MFCTKKIPVDVFRDVWPPLIERFYGCMLKNKTKKISTLKMFFFSGSDENLHNVGIFILVYEMSL